MTELNSLCDESAIRKHDWRIMPNVILPTSPPSRRLVCAFCEAQSSAPIGPQTLYPADPKTWPVYPA